ncbi:MAG: hypothetical protein AB7O45_16640 [Alphaproteobacteria bacterium]
MLAMALAIAMAGGAGAQAPSASGTPAPIAQQTVSGQKVWLPRGWKVTARRSGDDQTILAHGGNAGPGAPVLGMITVAKPAGAPLRTWSNSIVRQLLEGQATETRVIEETELPNGLLQLHRIDGTATVGNIATFAYIDPSRRGALVFLFFAAREDEFIAWNGAVLPLVAFGGIRAKAIDQLRPGPSARRNESGPQGTIAEMNRLVRQQAVLKARGGWCVRGEAGCS